MDRHEECDGDCRQCGVVEEEFVRHPHQPTTFYVPMVDGVKVMPVVIPMRDTILPQHSHPYDHISFVCSGEVDVWADDAYLGQFNAPASIVIKAGVKHKFQTLSDNTIIACIHNASRRGAVEFNDDHHLVNQGDVSRLSRSPLP